MITDDDTAPLPDPVSNDPATDYELELLGDLWDTTTTDERPLIVAALRIGHEAGRHLIGVWPSYILRTADTLPANPTPAPRADDELSAK